MRKLRRIRFVANDPLIDQPIEHQRVSFGFAVNELLVTLERFYIAEKNDVDVDASNDSIDRSWLRRLLRANNITQNAAHTQRRGESWHRRGAS